MLTNGRCWFSQFISIASDERLFSDISLNSDPWVSVDLLSSTLVSGVITQGRRNAENRVFEYKVAYQTQTSSDYEYVLNVTGGVKVMQCS